MLSKENILDLCRADSQTIETTEGEVRVRVPTAADRDRLDQFIEKSAGDWGGIRAWAMSQVLISDDGARMFDSAEEIKNLPAAISEQIWRGIAPLFGFDVEVGK